MSAVSERARAADAEFVLVRRFVEARLGEGEDPPGTCDFTFGNPHEMPLEGLVAALRHAIEPQRPDWFAYKTSEETPRKVIAAALTGELGLPFAPEDIALTQGAFGAIALAFRLVMDRGAEVTIPVPGWFCYASTARAADLVPVKVPLKDGSFDLDLDAIDAAITQRTRMVVVNTPHNPTGRIYPRAMLQDLADLLEAASARIGARIWLLSDEPYRRIRFDGAGFTSPAALYPWTLIDYSYGKVLLAPGQRLGYLALSPLMPEAERTALRAALFPTQMALGWTFPDAVMQHSVPALESLTLDMESLTAKRDRMYGALTQWGYRMLRPEGTFYLWGEAPGGDATAFAAALAKQNVHVMPGTLFDRPADFRLCLTATEDMIETALPAFRVLAPLQ
jgi:aspartate aminotransferase